MPEMDGLETLKHIRAMGGRFETLPVIALTADAMVGDRERYMAAGMSDYVSKPIDERQLITVVTRYLSEAAPDGTGRQSDEETEALNVIDALIGRMSA